MQQQRLIELKRITHDRPDDSCADDGSTGGRSAPATRGLNPDAGSEVNEWRWNVLAVQDLAGADRRDRLLRLRPQEQWLHYHQQR